MFAGVCVPSAAVGHTMMSGAAIPPWMLALTFTAALAAAWAAAGRERGRLFVTATAVTTQLVLHASFSLGQAAATTGKAGGSLAQQWAAVLLCGTPSATSMSAADAARVVRAAGLGSHLLDGRPPPTHSMPGMPGMPGMTHGYDAVGMIGAHLAVAVLCGLWLAYGERTAFRIGRVVATRLTTPIRLILWTPRTPHVPRTRTRLRRDTTRPRSPLLSYVIITRGPPRGIAVATP